MQSLAPTVEISMIDQKVYLSPSKPQRHAESADRPQLQFLNTIDTVAILLVAVFLLGMPASANPMLGEGTGCRYHSPASQRRSSRLMQPHDGAVVASNHTCSVDDMYSSGDCNNMNSVYTSTTRTFQLNHSEVVRSASSNLGNLAIFTSTTPSRSMSNRIHSPIDLMLVPLTSAYSNGRGGYLLLGHGSQIKNEFDDISITHDRYINVPVVFADTSVDRRDTLSAPLTYTIGHSDALTSTTYSNKPVDIIAAIAKHVNTVNIGETANVGSPQFKPNNSVLKANDAGMISRSASGVTESLLNYDDDVPAWHIRYIVTTAELQNDGEGLNLITSANPLAGYASRYLIDASSGCQGLLVNEGATYGVKPTPYNGQHAEGESMQLGQGGFTTNVSGSANISGGTLSLDFLNGYLPTQNNSYQFLLANSYTGNNAFSSYTSNINGLSFSYSNGQVTVGNAPPPVPEAPTAFSMLGMLGMGGVGYYSRKRRSSSRAAASA